MPEQICVQLEIEELPKLTRTRLDPEQFGSLEVITFPFEADNVLSVHSMDQFEEGLSFRFVYNTNKQILQATLYPTTNRIKITFHSLKIERNLKLEGLLK